MKKSKSNYNQSSSVYPCYDSYYLRKRNDGEQLCKCGKCRYCEAWLISEDDSDNKSCSRCNGAGCSKCESEF